MPHSDLGNLEPLANSQAWTTIQHAVEGCNVFLQGVNSEKQTSPQTIKNSTETTSKKRSNVQRKLQRPWVPSPEKMRMP